MTEPPQPPAIDLASQASSPDLVERIIGARQKRKNLFGEDLFVDPAWDILLELYAARLRRRRVVMPDVYAAAEVPPSTAARWIDLLERRGWIKRVPGSADPRRIYVELSDNGSNAMDTWMAYCSEGLPSG